MYKYFLATLLLYLCGCSADPAYRPSYIISDKAHEEKANQEEEAVKPL